MLYGYYGAYLLNMHSRGAYMLLPLVYFCGNRTNLMVTFIADQSTATNSVQCLIVLSSVFFLYLVNEAYHPARQ